MLGLGHRLGKPRRRRGIRIDYRRPGRRQRLLLAGLGGLRNLRNLLLWVDRLRLRGWLLSHRLGQVHLSLLHGGRNFLPQHFVVGHAELFDEGRLRASTPNQHRRDGGHAIHGCVLTAPASVGLDQLQLAGEVPGQLVQDRCEGSAGTAGRRVEVDQVDARIFDVGLERGVFGFHDPWQRTVALAACGLIEAVTLRPVVCATGPTGDEELLRHRKVSER